MRKNILTSALILGGITAYASSFNFTTHNVPVELINGETIEITLKQELPIDEYPKNFINASTELSRQTLDHEKMLRILNKIRFVEEEIKEDLPF